MASIGHAIPIVLPFFFSNQSMYQIVWGDWVHDLVRRIAVHLFRQMAYRTHTSRGGIHSHRPMTFQTHASIGGIRTPRQRLAKRTQTKRYDTLSAHGYQPGRMVALHHTRPARDWRFEERRALFEQVPEAHHTHTCARLESCVI